jgi:ribosomal protein S18 acetylase RimI-like enzyme
MLHIVKSRALVLFRLPCFFAKIENKIVGLWAIEDYHASLIVASLAVAKEYRRLGIATCILDYIEAMAIRMGKKWLEVAVLRKNVPAQHLYRKFGFVFTESRRTHFIMRGKKPL